MNGPKKICIVSSIIPPHFSGSGIRAYKYALRLKEKNLLAFVLTQKLEEGAQGTTLELQSLPSNMIITVPEDIYKGKDRKNKLRYFKDFLGYQVTLISTLFWKIFQNRNSFSIIHCIEAGSWLSLYSVLIGKMFHKKTILEMTLLDSDDPLSIKKNTNWPIGLLRYWLFSKADVIISISPALTKAYKLSGMPITKLREVPNSVDTDQFSPISEAEKISLRSQMGYHENQIIVLCVGAIIKRKGMDLLIKAFQKFKNRHDNALLILVGPIPSSDNKRIRKGYQEYLEIKKMIDDFQLGHFIQLTGTKNNIDEYMKISDFFVFLSRQEGLPNVLLESMSTGLPVITLNRAGVTGYIIRNKIDGIIVDEENPEKIALEMEHLINNDDLYHNISIHSRNTILDRFTDQIIDHQYEEIYEEIS